MKKIFLLAIALIMTLSLAACGGETTNSVSLVDVTSELGISMKLPSDMTLQENLAYVNKETGDSVVFASVDVVAGEFPISQFKEEDILTMYQQKYDDVAIKSFENGKQINGKEALVSAVNITTPKGNAITITLVMVTDGNKNYVINSTHGRDDKEGSLVKNLQTCIESITIK